MNTVSLFGAAPFPTAWFQTLLCFSALTMVALLPEMPRPVLRVRPVPVSLPLGCLCGLAAASVMAGIMEPELLAAVFTQV